MRYIIKSIVINSVCIYLFALLFPGIRYGSIKILITAAIVYSLLTIFIKPLLKILAFPFNLITFGLFSAVIDIFLLYLAASLVSDFSVVPFTLQSLHVFGLQTPSLHLNTFWSYFFVSACLGFASSFIWWIVG